MGGAFPLTTSPTGVVESTIAVTQGRSPPGRPTATVVLHVMYHLCIDDFNGPLRKFEAEQVNRGGGEAVPHRRQCVVMVHGCSR